ncbi:DUF1642 domain-containing protein [Enterococcus mundtii]|uniref:DUF1642 domain-containing protein n=1 Tax=Enterococcus mundtii TaxID=53346 RepID=UPI0010BE6A9F|nr:DUF1642 domain-containing protein [Enterococcus mundtii]QCJ56123.1 hypothetical protein DDJ96_05670 [Enterococcus mundtii]
MDIKELIERYKTKYAEEPKDWKHPSVNASRQDLFANFIRDLEQLDEPQKPVVPKFVAEWIEYAKKKGDSLRGAFCPWELYGAEYIKANNWIDANQETFGRAWLIGYEVEKEPLYMVPLLTGKEGHQKILVERRGEYDIIWDYKNEGDWHELLTEEQIKSVNPDYWKLAVLYESSEEVVEG